MTKRRGEGVAARGRASGGRRPGVDLLALGAALATLAGLSSLVGSRTGPQREPTAPPVRAVLLDQSASVTRGRPGWRRWAIRQLASEGRRAAAAGEDVAVVTFARGAELRFGPSPAAAFSEALAGGDAAAWLEPPLAGDLETDLGAAARVALEAVGGEERPPGTLVLLGDGRGGSQGLDVLLDPRARTAELIQPPAAALPDVGIRGVQLPETVEPGVLVPVRLDLFLSGPLPVTEDPTSLEVEWELAFTSAQRTVASRTLRGQESVPLTAAVAAAVGERSLVADLRLPPLSPGSGALSVTVRPSTLPADATDTFPENDRADASIRVGDPVRVVVVSPSPSVALEVPWTRRAFDGIEAEVVGPPGLRARLLGAVPPDVIVTLDVPLSGLPEAALRRFVLDGGGWVHGAGWTALRDEGPLLQPLLALEPDREPRPPLDIAFLVDGSGSMGGARWERVREALSAIVPTTSSRDRMELRFFTQVVSRPQLVFDGSHAEGAARSRGRSEAVEGLLRARVPGGSTDILYSLDGLAGAREQRARGEQEQGLIVLITDGITNSVWGLRGKVRARIAAAGDRLIVVKVGADETGGRFLDGLVLEGEEVLAAGELEGLEDLLQQELMDVRLMEGVRVVAAPDPGAATDGWLGELRGVILEAAGLEQPLVLSRTLRSRTVEGASALLDVETAAGSVGRGTLVAIAERGAGTVVGVALPTLGLGAEAWSPEAAGRLAWLAPVLRTMARRSDEAGERAPRARATLTPEGRLVVRGLPAGLPARLEAALTVAPTEDLFGALGERPRVGVVELTVPPVGPAPESVRAGRRPVGLDRLPRGTDVALELPAPALPVSLRADGPREAYPAARAPLAGFLPRAGAAPRDDAGEDAGDEPAPHPFTPALLWAAAACLALGALGVGPRRAGGRRDLD